MWSSACLLLRILLLTSAAPVPDLPGVARYTGYNCYEGFGGQSLDADSAYGDPFPEPLTPQQCHHRCVKDHRCEGFLLDGRHVRPGEPAEGPCWLRAALMVEECKGADSTLEPYDLFVITDRSIHGDESSSTEGHLVHDGGSVSHQEECEREFVACLRVTDEERRTEHMHTCDRELRACVREAKKGEHRGYPAGGGHEHAASLEDIETSVMLLVFLGLIMFVFILVNYRDNDIRLYAWKILSSTISIFTSVLVFNGLNGFGELLCYSQFLLFLYQLSLFAVALALLQITILCTAGVCCTSLKEGSLEELTWVFVDVTRGEHDQPLTAPQVEQLDKALCLEVAALEGAHRQANERNRELQQLLARKKFSLKRIFRESTNEGPARFHERFVQRKPLELMWRMQWAKGFGMLFGHIAGFAAISAGSTLQHSEAFGSSGVTALVPVFIVALLFWVSFQVTDLVRKRCLSSLSVKDTEPRRKIVEEAAEHGEHDAAALPVSFLFIVAVRYMLVGQLANVEGIEEFESRASTPGAWQVAKLALFGVGCLAIGIATVLCSARDKARVIHVVEAGSLMTFAWAMLFSVRWWTLRWHLLFFSSIMGRFVVAALCTVSTGGVIWMLDWVENRMERKGIERPARPFMDLLINAFGVLIGFSWELCFEGAVQNVAAMTPFPLAVDLALSVALACFVLVPWSKYILLKVMLLERIRDAKKYPPKSATEDQPLAADEERPNSQTPLANETFRSHRF